MADRSLLTVVDGQVGLQQSGDVATLNGPLDIKGFVIVSTTGDIVLTSTSNDSLVVGYNQTTNGGARSFIGGGQGCTSCATDGFIGAGKDCVISGNYAAVLSGNNNDALADYAVIGGGQDNTANGTYAVVVGGKGCTASGNMSIAGGESANASGNHSLVLGGLNNTASGDYSVVLSGNTNTASGEHSVAGGASSTASGNCSVALGSTANASGNYSVAIGLQNKASGVNSCALGGRTNNITGNYSGILSGCQNTISSGCAAILAGYNNSVTADFAVAAGRDAVAEHLACFALSAGKITTAGDAQLIRAVTYVQTNSGTASDLYLDGNSKSISLVQPENTVWVAKCWVAGMNANGVHAASYYFVQTTFRDGNAAPALTANGAVSNPYNLVMTEGDTNWNAAINIRANNIISASAVGTSNASVNYNWVATWEIVQLGIF